MNLSPRDLYRLTTAMANLQMTRQTLERCTALAKLPRRLDIHFTDSTWDLCSLILSKVDSNKTAIELLNVIIAQVPNGDILIPFRDELQSSRIIRQQKVKEALENGRCVIFLGPDALKVKDDDDERLIAFNDYVCRHLSETMASNYIYHFPHLDKNLSYLAQCYDDDPQAAQGEVAGIAAEIYNDMLENKRFDRALFDDLAKLPLKLVINANPDNLLLQSLKTIGGGNVTSNFYSLANDAPPERETQIISRKAPFIYNIFGSFEKVDSVLFTEKQFMEFINAIIQDGPTLNASVVNEFIESDTYLFLGFDFEQWYLKILFQLLKIKKDEYSSVSCGFDPLNYQADIPAGAAANIYNREFFEREFKIYFVNEGFQNFITQIVRLFQP